MLCVGPASSSSPRKSALISMKAGGSFCHLSGEHELCSLWGAADVLSEMGRVAFFIRCAHPAPQIQWARLEMDRMRGELSTWERVLGTKRSEAGEQALALYTSRAPKRRGCAGEARRPPWKLGLDIVVNKRKLVKSWVGCSWQKQVLTRS
jgi:hypothetical protein